MQISMSFTCGTKMNARSALFSSSLLIFIIQCVCGELAESVTALPIEAVEVNKCPAAYKYKNFQTEQISVPEQLVSNGKPLNFRFGLRYQGCNDGETIIYALPTNNVNLESETPSSLHDSLRDQFLPDGKLRFQSRYYHNEDFCISNANESHIFLEICKRSCQSKTRPCIPKCCDLSEVIQYENRTAKCSPSGAIQWKPFLYETPHVRFMNLENQFTDKVKPQLEKVALRKVFYEKWPTRDLTHIAKTWRKKSWKILSSGQVVFLDKTRRWIPFPPGLMCIDGLQNMNNEGAYDGEERNQILFFIPDSVTAHSDKRQLSQLYGILSYVSCVFYFVIAVGYMILARNQNVHGWTILSYMISLFFMSILFGTSHFCGYISNPPVKLNTVQAVALAASAHYFILSSYFWISVMSFDLLLTFNTVMPSSCRSKGVKRFLAYSGIGWGFPLVIVSSSVLLDQLYSDIETEVLIPEYGKFNYFIAPWAQGVYLYYIIAIILGLNLFFAAMTVASICKFRRSTNLLSKGDISTKNRDFLSFKLYAKLFIVMGILWTFELISWLHTQNENPWYWVIVDVIANLQSIALFFIFLCNRSAFSKLKDYVEGFGRSVRGSVTKLSSFRRSSSQETDITRISF